MSELLLVMGLWVAAIVVTAIAAASGPEDHP